MLTYWKRPWCWARLKAGGEGDNRWWNCWMASLTCWTLVWASSQSWCCRPGMLQYLGSHRVGHDWVTELTDILAWPKVWVSWKSIWSPNELFGQPNINVRILIQELIFSQTDRLGESSFHKFLPAWQIDQETWLLNPRYEVFIWYNYIFSTDFLLGHVKPN